MGRTLTGVVTSDKRDKTITVSVIERATHPIYKKQFTLTRKYTAHDEKNAAKIGDKVIIAEGRPISKTKTWSLAEIIDKSKGKVELKEDVTEITSEVKAESSEEAEPKKPARAKKTEEAKK